MAKKNRTTYVCQNCSFQSFQWVGKCPECGEWNSFVEENIVKQDARTTGGKVVESTPKLIEEISIEKHARDVSGIKEFDRVMGGGIVQGSLVLIGGEPGVGKSTLLTNILGRLSTSLKNEKVLYVSGEESEGQIANRVRRLNIESNNLYIYHQTNWQRIKNEIALIRPKYIVLDSIQTTISDEIQSAPGTVSQIREVTYELMNYVKANGITAFVIGHITKEGAIAGPKILEHMVDTVVYFEGDQFGHYRLLRAIKNRFGNTNEVGIFEMREDGLHEVPNPSQYFLDENLVGAFGRSLTCIVEGSRTLFVEIQALVVENKFGNGRRTTQGLDNNRLAMLVAVIEKYFDISIGLNDIYLNVVGGIKLVSRESDLSIIASLLSSYKSKPIDNNTVFLGEVGLTGEVRSVPHIEMRLREMEQLNYKRVITSAKVASKYSGKFNLNVVGISRAQEIEEFL